MTECGSYLLNLKRDLFVLRTNDISEVNGMSLNQFGDMYTCENHFSSTIEMQYVLVKVQGNHSIKQFFYGAGEGKYFSYGSLIGVCMPLSCDTSEIESMTPYYYNLAIRKGYLEGNITISFDYPTQIANDKESESNPALFVVWAILLVVFSVCCLGTLIEVTQLGNRLDLVFKDPHQDSALLSKFSTWNKKLLLSKEYWSFFFLAFSMIRNNLFILSRRRKASEYKMATQKTQRIVDYMDVIDGIKAFNLLLICYAYTFSLVKYGIDDTKSDFTKQSEQSLFFQIFISGAAQSAIEISFFLTGF